MSVLYNGSRRGKGTFWGRKRTRKPPRAAVRKHAKNAIRRTYKTAAHLAKLPSDAARKSQARTSKNPPHRGSPPTANLRAKPPAQAAKPQRTGPPGKARRLVRKAATRRPAPGAAATPKATARPQHARRSPARWQAAARKQKRRLGKPRHLRESRLDASWHGCP